MEPIWEQHKPFFLAAAGFLAALLLVWLVFVRGYDAAATQLDEEFEKGRKDREALCPESRGRTVAELTQRISGLNARIELEFKEQCKRLHYSGFPVPLVPEGADPKMYVRDVREETQKFLTNTLDTTDKVILAQDVGKFGLNPGTQLIDETLAQDEEWLRQYNIARRAIDLLHRVAVETDAKGVRIRHLRRLDKLQAGKPNPTGPDPKFIDEYPVDIEMMISLEGLMKLLGLCSTPETFHVVQSLTIDSAPGTRQVEKYEHTDTSGVSEQWYGHIYKVSLRLATMCVREDKLKTQGDAAPGLNSNPTQKPGTVLKH